MNQGKTIVLETVRLYLIAELKIALRRTPLCLSNKIAFMFRKV